jgi:excisionase family DNA binding protein
VLDLTGISRPTFYSHVKAGRIVARKLGRRTIVMAADLERYLESLPRLHEISQA